jgi:hypothetical protein
VCLTFERLFESGEIEGSLSWQFVSELLYERGFEGDGKGKNLTGNGKVDVRK